MSVGALNEAPQLKRYFVLNGLSALTFWVCVAWSRLGPDFLGVKLLIYFLGYLSVLVWLDSVFYIRECARGVVVESGDFQRERVKLCLFVVGVLIVAQLPSWLASILGQ